MSLVEGPQRSLSAPQQFLSVWKLFTLSSLSSATYICYNNFLAGFWLEIYLLRFLNFRVRMLKVKN